MSKDSGARHSPWVDSLDQMSEVVHERVNKGFQQTVSAITRILTPPGHQQSDEKSPAQEPAAADEAIRGSGLAPESAAHPPSDFYVQRSTRAPPGQLTDEEDSKSSKAKEKARRRADKKAQHEARRQAKKDRQRAKKEKRREHKERTRKEREWKKVEKQGGDLPVAIVQGLRISPDTKIPYNPRCEVCSKSAVAAISSSKWNPKCTLCGKAAQREATRDYMKSSKIQLGNVASLEDLINMTSTSVRRKKTTGDNVAGFQEDIDNELAKHMALHIQDYVSNGGEAALRVHTCNDKGQPGHLARQGLDGNRDSPTMVDGSQVIQCPLADQGIPSTSTTSEVDWWVRAVASSNSSTTHHRSGSPHPTAVAPLRR